MFSFLLFPFCSSNGFTGSELTLLGGSVGWNLFSSLFVNLAFLNSV